MAERRPAAPPPGVRPPPQEDTRNRVLQCYGTAERDSYCRDGCRAGVTAATPHVSRSGPQRRGDGTHPVSLASRLHRPLVIVRAHPLHGFVSGDTAHRREDCEGRSRPADPTTARDLDALRRRTPVCVMESFQYRGSGTRQPEVAPVDPPVRPRDHPRITAGEIDAELRVVVVSTRTAQASAANAEAVRELDDPVDCAPAAHRLRLRSSRDVGQWGSSGFRVR